MHAISRSSHIFFRRSSHIFRSFSQKSKPSAPSLSPSSHSLILGKPGGGKGTISKKILASHPSHFTHLSTGDLLRTHVASSTPLGLQAKSFMDSGDLVPDSLIIDLVLTTHHNTMDGHLDHHQRKPQPSLLLDGFPRTLEQAEALAEYLPISCVFNLDIPDEVIVERISDRWIHQPSGRVYSYSYNPPKNFGLDDETNEELIQRDDDKPETVQARLKMYTEKTAPLVDFYEKQGVLRTFKGTESDVIFKEVDSFINELF